jgi:hypothetical protein
VHLVYNEIRPGSTVPSTTSYSSAGPGTVGQSQVYVISTTDDGATWSPTPIAVDPQTAGHQFFPDIDALEGQLAVVWQDSRTDPCYASFGVQVPMGNTMDATTCGANVVHTFVSVSSNGTTFSPIADPASDVAHQPEFEMFGNRDIPFQGDYNWISLAVCTTGATCTDGEVFGYFTWTDNRDVVTGTDPREDLPADGFDVLQCRTATDGTFGPDTCANAGGLNQNIYGNSLEIT